ncbi:MAG TPA: hypothetical protein VJR48_12825 [Ktedonobacterales bacterium]|nr:hypothetical protein [Ktedonobacterales bacterium]
MAHAITLNDEQYARLAAAARAADQSPDEMLGTLLNWLPATQKPLTAEEYERRWHAFWDVVGSIQHGDPLTSEQMEEMIGEEIAQNHADTSA